MRRIKCFQQLEHADCGIACIRIIAHYYGKNIPLNTLRELCDISRIGITIRDILHCTQALGFNSCVTKVTMDEVKRMPLPAILYWEQKHFVVLYKIDNNKYYVADPGEGKIIFGEVEFKRFWQSKNDYGIAVVMDPTPSFFSAQYGHEEKRGLGLFKLMRRAILSNRRDFFFVTLLTTIAMLADMLLPMMLQHTIDDGITGKNLHLIWLLIMGQFCIFLGNFTANSITDILLTRVGLKIFISMINEYLKKLIFLPISFYDRKVKSDLIQKLDDHQRIKSFLVNMPETIFLTAINLIAFSTMMVYYNSLIFFIFVVSTLIGILWTRLFLQKRKVIDYSLFSYTSENRNNVYELIYGMAEIKINNAQETRVDIWNEIQEKINRLSIKAAILGLYIRGGNTLIYRLKDILITGLCATFVVKGQMTLGIMMTINYIAGRLSVPFSNIVNSISNIQDASMSYERIQDINTQPTDILDDDREITSNVGDIILKDISFKYPGSFSPFIFNHLNVSIPQGKTTAIVGESGCGKTTLLKLLLGFYKPQSGGVYIGASNIQEIGEKQWLSKCSAVMQDGYIFTGPIIDNIALADKEPDIERVRNASQIACIDEFVNKLPMGYYTKIGVTGLELSGGQKQRLFIARAIYKQPDFLFLDEATSSLDANNEHTIVQNLKKFGKKRTVVIAAHRLSTIRHADKIIYMDSGIIKEQGTHEELIALKGYYYQLVKNQMGTDEAAYYA